MLESATPRHSFMKLSTKSNRDCSKVRVIWKLWQNCGVNLLQYCLRKWLRLSKAILHCS